MSYIIIFIQSPWSKVKFYLLEIILSPHSKKYVFNSFMKDTFENIFKKPHSASTLNVDPLFSILIYGGI